MWPGRWTRRPVSSTIVGVKEQRITMGQLWDLIQEHIDAQPYPPSERRIARELDVSPTTLSNWREPKKLVAKEHLVKIAQLTRNPYRRVLDALLADIDYLDEGSGGSGRSAAPMKTKRPTTARGWQQAIERARAIGRMDLVEQLEEAAAADAAAKDDVDRRGA